MNSVDTEVCWQDGIMTVMKEKTGEFSVRMLDFQGSDGYDKEKMKQIKC